MLLHFAQRVARQAVDYYESPGNLEGCQTRAATFFYDGCIEIVCYDNPGYGHFTLGTIRDAAHCGFRDLRLLLQNFHCLRFRGGRH